MTATNAHPPSAALSNMQSSSPSQTASSPPSKRDLASWWSGFKKKTKKEEEKVEPPPSIFGVPLATSIKYANVAISLTNENGESYIYGYVPIIIAKCGVFLKEKGTDVHGIFRLPGSAKRIKELQGAFDMPDRYGKGLDWTGYTVHDAGSIFRRYINSLPEPVIPLTFYELFRAPIREHQKEASGDPDAPPDPRPATDFDHSAAIATYQKLITELPPLNRQLLLYLLDLLAVFASKHEVNGMDSFNLSAIFQPGMLSHPKHDLFPVEYKLSQNVLVYLILNQDHFLVGMSGTEADEKTVKDVQSGAKHQPQPQQKATYAGLGRSASNASAGADSLRRTSGMRRNVSGASKASNLSANKNASPASSSPLATTGSSGGVHRSNTVPSKRSPGLHTPTSAKAAFMPEEVGRESPGPNASTTAENQAGLHPAGADQVSTPGQTIQQTIPEGTEASQSVPEGALSEEPSAASGDKTSTGIAAVTSPSKEKKSIFAKQSPSDNDKKQPNKLRKKSRPSDSNKSLSAQSSTHSLSGAAEKSGQNTQLSSADIPALTQTAASPTSGEAPQIGELDKVSSLHVSQHSGSRPPSPSEKAYSKSPIPSVHSGLVTEESEAEQGATTDKSAKRRSRWRLSTSAKKDAEKDSATGTSTASAKETSTSGSRLGASAVVPEEPATANAGSGPDATANSHTEAHAGPESTSAAVSSGSGTQEREIEGSEERERKGLFGRIKAKVASRSAKSPPRAEPEKPDSHNHQHQPQQQLTTKTIAETAEAPMPLPTPAAAAGPVAPVAVPFTPTEAEVAKQEPAP